MSEIPFINELGDRLEAVAAAPEPASHHRLRARLSRSWRTLALWAAGAIALAGGGATVAAWPAPGQRTVEDTITYAVGAPSTDPARRSARAAARTSPAPDHRPPPRELVHSGA